jgi:uncharacterized damage-inducible protein DinB
MLSTMIGGVLGRDLRALRRELEAYPDERGLWAVPRGVSNTAGNLAMHLAGNLRMFVGAQLGGIGYVRDRDAEFNRRDVPRAELLRQVDDALVAVEQTMPMLRDEDLDKPYPMRLGGTTVTTGDFLIHLATHLTYHLGQIDYHRRVVTGDAGAIAALSPAELSSARSSG